MRKIITISREFGSGGRELGRYLAQELDLPYYDGSSTVKSFIIAHKPL